MPEKQQEFLEFATRSKTWEEHARVPLTKGQWQLQWAMELKGNAVVRIRVGRSVLGTYHTAESEVGCSMNGKKVVTLREADDFIFECKMRGTVTAEVKRGKFVIKPLGRGMR